MGQSQSVVTFDHLNIKHLHSNRTSLQATLITGNCTEELPKIQTDSIDLIVTDPPYNLGLFMKDRATNLARMRENYFGAAGWDNDSEDDWLALIDSFLRETVRVLKPGGALIVFMSILKVETVVKLATNYGLYYKTTGI